MTDAQERRVEKRSPQQEAFSLKVIFTSDSPNLLGRTYRGDTIDVSPSGLGVLMSTELPVDSTIDVEVMLKGNPKKYFLSGKVRWCKQAENSHYFTIGINLQDLINTETDYKAWRAAFK